MSTRVCARVRGSAARRAGWHTDTRGRARNSALGSRPGRCSPPRCPRPPPAPRALPWLFKRRVSSPGAGWGRGRGARRAPPSPSPGRPGGAAPAGAPPARSFVPLPRKLPVPALPARSLLTRTGPPGHTERGAFFDSASPPLPRGLPGRLRMPGWRVRRGVQLHLTLPSNLGRRSAEHMTFC